MEQFSDIELIKYYRKSGNKEAVGELFKRYTLMCLAVCRKYLNSDEESKDAVMQVFEKLFTDLNKHDIQNFRSWLHSVCRNHCLMQLRLQPQMVSIADQEEIISDQVMESDEILHPFGEGSREDKLQQLEQALDKLNENQKLCISLFYLKEKSYQQIADETGLQLNEIKSHIQNGKRNLKNLITPNDGILLLLIGSVLCQMQ